MGDGSRRLFALRKLLGLFSARSRAKPRVSLGRRWPAWYFGSTMPARFALALWNGKNSILKERLCGLTGSEGNHGEDVKALYYYLDSPTRHSFMTALDKYPESEYPYAPL